MNHSLHRLKKGGYTLVELIVALGVFSVVVTLAAGAYFIVLGATRHAQANATAVDSLSFVLEKMTRSIRTGTGYGGSTNEFSFTDARGNGIIYNVSEGVIQETKNGGEPSPITDASVRVSELEFTLSGAPPGDTKQPHVTIFVLGTISTGPGEEVPFTIQTGATMRGIDL